MGDLARNVHMAAAEAVVDMSKPHRPPLFMKLSTSTDLLIVGLWAREYFFLLCACPLSHRHTASYAAFLECSSLLLC